ncbi:uncharacterized protein LOC124445949 [Xenia sp. Carnegie-2017]|uniref:uncharacterized protein LOC124445949 n=1 Tax=Xenia sp. Carnegie-2017 TaxID=2897299 RepID=UPI001F03A9D1|nr:uncharacterized protein LOC124445949 [Xenia sp. Carnegie-2017]
MSSVETTTTFNSREGKGFSSISGNRNNKGPHTVYTMAFQGFPCSRSKPYRAETSDHLPTGWPFENSNYNETYTPKYCTKYNLHPVSVHRKNNPHPVVFDPWKHPCMRFQVWKPGTRLTETAPASYARTKLGRRFWETSYNTSFSGKRFDCLPKISQVQENEKSGKANLSLHMMSMYKHDYIADKGRPSTLLRPRDRSFMNLSM